jgi:hypothetical protein
LEKRFGGFLSQQRKSTVNVAARLVVAGLGLIGLLGVAPIAYRHVTGIETCPMLGPVPACNVVLLGYLLVAVSVFLRTGFRTPLFIAGWIPVFGLAVMASGLEVLGNDVCPRGAYNIPTCFYSLALTTSLIAAFLFERFYRSK